MRKSCKRRVRKASEPAMVRMEVIKDVSIAQRFAIEAIRGGWATYDNSYRVLADCHGVLVLGLRKKSDISMKGIVQGALIAMLNIFDRMKDTGKVGATGEELKMLEQLTDASDDFWKRQSSSLLEECIYANALIRKRQLDTARKAA